MGKQSMEKKRKIAEKRAAKRATQLKPGESSNYAKKSRYCSRHGIFGFEVAEPKPWKC